jgi:gamma-glutamylcyclotransferase (GGCT)/AIG2-like uncharacterized protein YtfP
MKLRDVSLKATVRTALCRNEYTEDVVTMQSLYDQVPVFVYGTEKNRYHHHKIMGDNVKPVGYGWTEGKYVLRIHRKYLHPVAFYAPSEPAANRLYGEIYMVTPDRLFELDAFHQNGLFMQRRWRTIYGYHADQSIEDRSHIELSCLAWTAIPSKHYLSDYDEGGIIQGVKPYYMWRITDDAKCQYSEKTSRGATPWDTDDAAIVS